VLKLELKKKKYKKAEVEVLIEGIKAEYELKFIELRNKIRDLVKENNDLRMEIEVHTDREELILATLARAEITAKEIERKAELQYKLEVERIKNFSKKWDEYFEELKKKYPLYSATKKTVKINEELKSLTSKNGKAKDIINKLDSNIDEKKKKFNPKSKIDEYMATTNDTGFNMDEVLNPGALKLEDLCKELGLIEENE
jgi:hypothetical protein